jgi:uncharacterized protein (DUF2147 family)
VATTMRRHILALALLAVAAAAACSANAQSEPATLFGVWSNPMDTVHVEIRACGASACGTVIWATNAAQADARRGSGRDLVGLQLFHDLSQRSATTWHGKVFVPDLDITLNGTAGLVDSERLRVKGCLLGGFVCRTQTWTRVPTPERPGPISLESGAGAWPDKGPSPTVG